MARQPRLILPGHPHHIIQRGNNRQAIVESDSDRDRFLALLKDAARTHDVALHAYVLMDNHVHLLATPTEATGLSRMMQSLGRRYVAWFNATHGRTGTLWEGRFRASLIESERYLLACMRYIELNPVRARICPSAADHPWSSARHHLGATADPLVTEHALYWELGNTPFERQAAYAEFLAHGVAAAEAGRMTDSVIKGWPLGGERFLGAVAAQTSRAVKPRARGRPAGSDSRAKQTLEKSI